MKEAYALASKRSKSPGHKGKKQYDKINSSVLQRGDRVLVLNLSKRGPLKYERTRSVEKQNEL